MRRFFLILATISVFMVLIAGFGAYLISKTLIAQSKVDAVSAVGKGVAVTLSEQINLLNATLDKMAQDPEIINAVAQNNPDQLTQIETKLTAHFPNALWVKIILAEVKPGAQSPAKNLSFADQETVRLTFTEDQFSAIQGDSNSDRHLVIARRIMQNNQPIAVILAGVSYDFITRIVSAVSLEKGYIELRQDKLVLASAGENKSPDAINESGIPVPNTNWEIFYANRALTNAVEFSLIFAITIIPALMVALGFVIGYRKFSDMLTNDLSWVVKAFKDIVTGKILVDYPAQLGQVRTVISTLLQFKRVIDDKNFEI